LSSVADYVKLAEEEKIIKDYNALKKPQDAKEGHLCITNKRVIMYSYGTRLKPKQVRTVCDIQINCVRGVDISSKGVSLIRIIAGLILLLIGIAFDALTKFNLTFVLFSLIPIAVGLGLIYLGIRHRGFFMIIDVDAVTPAMLMFAGTGWSMKHLSFLLIGKAPGPDADILKQEFGAIILDTQIGRESLLSQTIGEKQQKGRD